MSLVQIQYILLVSGLLPNIFPASGAILSNILSSQLRTKFSPRLVAQLTSSAFALDELDLSDADKQLIMHSYMDGLHAVFVSYTVLIVIHVCACVCIEDYGLKRGEEHARDQTEGEDSGHCTDR